MSKKGWWKLHRCLFEKPIWKNSTYEQKIGLITILNMANPFSVEDEWKGEKVIIPAGSFLTTVESLRKNIGKSMSAMKTRTMLERFRKLDFLTIETTNKKTLVTVVNWKLYQDPDDQITNGITNGQQTDNKRITNENEDPLNRNGYTLENNKNERTKERDNMSGNPTPSPITEIINYLNSVLNTHYKTTTKKNRALVKARLNEGFSVADFFIVIDKKYLEWGKDPKMSKYLRPETLFGNKFESYLQVKNNQVATAGSTGNSRVDYNLNEGFAFINN